MKREAGAHHEEAVCSSLKKSRGTHRGFRSFGQNRRGQFVVVAALLIAILTLSIAYSIHELSSHRRELAYKPVNELIMAITSDLERALTYSLSNASKMYYMTALEYELETAQAVGNLSGCNNMLRWQRGVLSSHPQLGMELRFNQAPSFSFSWGEPVGLTQAIVPNYELDITAYGFKGWSGHSSKYVSLKITNFVYLNSSFSAVDFTATQFVTPANVAAPIPNLTIDDIKNVTANLDAQAWLPGTPETPEYLGGGNYRMVFRNPTDQRPRAVSLMISTPEDEILVSARMTANVSVWLKSQNIDSLFPDQDNPDVTIALGSTEYSLPQNIINWEQLQPGLRCIFNSLNYSFVNWTVTGDIYIDNPYYRETTVSHYGNGTIIAFYEKPTSTSSAYNLTINSRLEGSTQYANLGSVKLDSYPDSNLPFNATLQDQDHSVTYAPDADYTFTRWEFSPSNPTWITISDDYASSINIRLFGNGTLTAVYDQRIILLDSYEYNETTSHLGNIDFGGYTYSLPTTLVPSNATVTNGQYNLSFTPSASAYRFMFWKITGNILLTGANESTTTVEIQGNGAITAVYGYMIDIPESIGGTFFVEAHGSKDYWLVPIPPDDHGHLASKASTGSGKAQLTVVSDPIPAQIICDRIVTVTAYIGIQPGNAPLRELEFTLGFLYEGTNYPLGYWKFTISGKPDTRYDLWEDISDANFPGEPYVIPEGSSIYLDLVATFTTPPGGTIFLFYGPDRPSCVTLFQ